MNRKRELLIRVYFVMFCFVAFTLIILWRIGTVSVIEGAQHKKKIDKYLKWIDEEGSRGGIYTDDGSTLAASIKFFEIRMDPTVPKDKVLDHDLDSLCIYLERYSDVKKSRWQWADYIMKSRKDGNRYIKIAKKVNYDLYRNFKQFPVFSLGANKGGFIAESEIHRAKPFRNLAARTIGLDRENANKVGIEAYYDQFLKGDSVKKLKKRIPGGRWIDVFEPSDIAVKKGADLFTTINIEIQDIVHDELQRAAIYQNAVMATAVIMEVETGAIKAISNLTRDDQGAYNESYNHAIGRSVEPGSTFKVATALSLLEDGYVTESSQVNIQGGKKKFYDLMMYDSNYPHYVEQASLTDVIVKSSNVGIATLSHKYYGKKNNRSRFYTRLDKMGLTRKTGINLIGEPEPYIKNPDADQNRYSGTTVPWMAHGYELKLTPLQILNFYNAIANDGKLMKPYLVSEIVKNGVEIKKNEPEILIESIASRTNIENVQRMLEEAVLRGTAKNIKSDKYDFAGKTGTSTTNYADKSVTKTKYNASFVGYFPAENPKYSMIVVMYDPKKEYYGNRAAGTVFKAIADKCYALDKKLSKSVASANEDNREELPKDGQGDASDFKVLFSYLNLNYKSDKNAKLVDLKSNGSKVLMKEKKVKRNTMPDVRGMGLKDAIYVLENLGVGVAVHGVGRVKSQNIIPGTKIQGQEIEIYLN